MKWPTTSKFLLITALAILTIQPAVRLRAQVAPTTDLPAEAPMPNDQSFGGKPPRASHAPYPDPDSGYVTDLAGLLTPDEEERIEQWLWQVEEESGIEIAVVTIDSIRDYPDTGRTSIETFATGLFDAYGIGNLPGNDGVLLLIARQDRKARIELGAGYGRARDGDARRIMDRVVIPSFQDDDYAEGITDGVEAIINQFADMRVTTNMTLVWSAVGIVVAIPMLVAIAISLFKNGKRGWGWVCVGLIFVLVLVLVRILIELARVAARRSERGSSGRWSSGGFGGGFGGGFSGGGGATGSW